MDATARLTSKGQVTIPKSVRDALGLETGDAVLFRVEQARATLSKTPDFIELAGSVPVPPSKRGMAWEDIMRDMRADRARRRR